VKNGIVSLIINMNIKRTARIERELIKKIKLCPKKCKILAFNLALVPILSDGYELCCVISSIIAPLSSHCVFRIFFIFAVLK